MYLTKWDWKRTKAEADAVKASLRRYHITATVKKAQTGVGYTVYVPFRYRAEAEQAIKKAKKK